MQTLVIAAALSCCSLAAAMTSVALGKHSWHSGDQLLEKFAAHAGFSDHEIDWMNEEKLSLYLMSTNKLGSNKGRKGRKGEAVTIGAQPALFFIELQIGTPAKHFRLNLDTGSSTLAIPAAVCRHCGSHCNDAFDFTQSSTFQHVTCASSECCSFGCPSSYCSSYPDTTQCGFGVSYGDGSSIQGAWVKDVVTVGNMSSVPMYFGTISQSSSSFEPFAVDGIVGVAMRSLNTNLARKEFDTIIDALYNYNNVPKVFSMCFGLSGGVMTFGGEDLDHMSTTPSYVSTDLTTGFYTVYVGTVSILGTTLSGSNHYAIIDSGTTLWIVPRNLYSSIASELLAHCGSACGKISSLISQRCVSMSTSQLQSLPTISVALGSHTLVIPPTAYIRTGLCSDSSSYAFGISEFSSTEDCGDISNPCIYGDVFMTPYTWVFDQQQSRVGFAPMVNCNHEGELTSCPNSDSDNHKTAIIVVAVVLSVLGLMICCCIALCAARVCCRPMQAREPVPPGQVGSMQVVLSNPLIDPKAQPSQVTPQQK